MTNEEFFNANMGYRVLYKGKDIGGIRSRLCRGKVYYLRI